jgi:hypothetical protein
VIDSAGADTGGRLCGLGESVSTSVAGLPAVFTVPAPWPHENVTNLYHRSMMERCTTIVDICLFVRRNALRFEAGSEHTLFCRRRNKTLSSVRP